LPVTLHQDQRQLSGNPCVSSRPKAAFEFSQKQSSNGTIKTAMKNLENPWIVLD